MSYLFPSAILLTIVGLFILLWFDKMPSVESFTRLLEALNTRGGNILLLLAGTIIGAASSLRLFYYIIQLCVDGKLQQDNVYGIMSLTFITGTITGNFMGALLKTMTGSESKPVSPIPPEKVN